MISVPTYWYDLVDASNIQQEMVCAYFAMLTQDATKAPWYSLNRYTVLGHRCAGAAYNECMNDYAQKYWAHGCFGAEPCDKGRVNYIFDIKIWL